MITQRIREHVRSNVVGYICLLWLMTGTAVAATQLPANSVGTKQLKRAAVTNPKLARGAVTAVKVAKGSLTGDRIKAGSLTGDRIKAGSLTGTQIDASTLGTVPTATHATDADQLGGFAASNYQTRVTGTCPRGIASIGPLGNTTCASPAVIAFVISANAGELKSVDLGQLTLHGFCHDSATDVGFKNNYASAGTLNWVYSDGGTSVIASGTSIDSGGADVPFAYAAKRLEGQWVFLGPGVVTTVHLHAFDGGGLCEVQGTAETGAPVP